jgi:hypothetical protein
MPGLPGLGSPDPVGARRLAGCRLRALAADRRGQPLGSQLTRPIHASLPCRELVECAGTSRQPTGWKRMSVGCAAAAANARARRGRRPGYQVCGPAVQAYAAGYRCRRWPQYPAVAQRDGGERGFRSWDVDNTRSIPAAFGTTFRVSGRDGCDRRLSVHSVTSLAEDLGADVVMLRLIILFGVIVGLRCRCRL